MEVGEKIIVDIIITQFNEEKVEYKVVGRDNGAELFTRMNMDRFPFFEGVKQMFIGQKMKLEISRPESNATQLSLFHEEPTEDNSIILKIIL